MNGPNIEVNEDGDLYLDGIMLCNGDNGYFYGDESLIYLDTAKDKNIWAIYINKNPYKRWGNIVPMDCYGDIVGSTCFKHYILDAKNECVYVYVEHEEWDTERLF